MQEFMNYFGNIFDWIVCVYLICYVIDKILHWTKKLQQVERTNIENEKLKEDI